MPSPKKIPTRSNFIQVIEKEAIVAIGALEKKALVGPWPQTLKGRSGNRTLRHRFLNDHSHDYLELSHLLSGRCALSYNRKTYNLNTGDLCFFPPGMLHAESYYKASQPYRLMWWIFGHQNVILHLMHYSQNTGYRVSDQLVINMPRQDLHEACRKLIVCAQGENPPEVWLIKEVLLGLIVTLLRKINAQTNVNASHARTAIVEQAKSYIWKHLAEPLTTAHVARAVTLSPNYLISLFHQETGLSLGNYIRRQRLGQAKLLLANTRKQIKEVAYELGFDDPKTFSRTFHRVEGISPIAYRETYRSRMAETDPF